MALQREVSPNVKLAVIAAFSALIALGTVASIPLPPPLFEITWSPAVFFALAVLTDKWSAFSATAIGSFLGEAYNVAYKVGGSPIYPFGMVWARAPEVLIIAWASRKGNKALALSMVLATVYETAAFFFPDWAFYTYGVFGYGSPTDIATGFYSALPDVFTLVDIVYVPLAFALIRAARPAFARLGFVR
ncbi:MAG: hypothetical protein JRM82_03480 [Nitrososphaerota archaeon]|nr:hypothetical protein [Nitrososphaerota archaeon]